MNLTSIVKLVLNIALVCATIWFIVRGMCDFPSESVDGNFKIKMKKSILFSLIPFALLVVSLCIVSVPANTVGVKWSPFGGTSEQTLSEGLAFKTPFDRLYFIPTTIDERTIEGVSVQTKDAQFVTMTVNVKFQVQPTNAFTVYKNFGTWDNMKQNIIGNYAQKAVENVVVTYNVIEVLGEKKNDIYEKATNGLKEKLEIDGIELKELTIKDMDAGAEIEKAIKDEAVAKKAVETAEQNRLKAEKDKETKIINAQAEAEASTLLTESLSQEVLQKMMLEKWNGILPVVTGGNNLFDLSSILPEEGQTSRERIKK